MSDNSIFEIQTVKRKLTDLYYITGIPVSTITTSDNYKMEHPAAVPLREYNVIHSNNIRNILKENKVPMQIPYLRHVFNSVYYVTLRLTEDIIVQLGPVASHTIYLTDYISNMSTLYPSFVINEQLKIIDGAPRADANYMIQVAVLMTNYLCQKQISKTDVLLSPGLTGKGMLLTNKSYKRSTISAGRLNLNSEAFQYIKNGDIDQLTKFQSSRRTSSLYYFQENDVSYLRLAMVIYGAISSHYAIRGGLSSKTVKDMLDTYISDIYEVAEIEDFWHMLPEYAMTLCEKVHETQEPHKKTRLLKLCTEYIDAHIYSLIDMAKLEEISGSSRKTIYRHFREYMNTTPSEYINDKRLAEAKRLLQNTSINLIDISSMLYYSSQSHFTKCFREKYGVTPSNFRNSTEKDVLKSKKMI